MRNYGFILIRNVLAPARCNRAIGVVIGILLSEVQRKLLARIVDVHDGVSGSIDRDRVRLLIRPEGAVHLCIQCAPAAARVRVRDLAAIVTSICVLVQALPVPFVNVVGGTTMCHLCIRVGFELIVQLTGNLVVRSIEVKEIIVIGAEKNSIFILANRAVFQVLLQLSFFTVILFLAIVFEVRLRITIAIFVRIHRRRAIKPDAAERKGVASRVHASHAAIGSMHVFLEATGIGCQVLDIIPSETATNILVCKHSRAIIRIFIVIRVLAPVNDRHSGFVRYGRPSCRIRHVGLHDAYRYPIAVAVKPTGKLIPRFCGAIRQVVRRAILCVNRLRAIDATVGGKLHHVVVALIVDADDCRTVRCDRALLNLTGGKAGVHVSDCGGIGINAACQLH